MSAQHDDGRIAVVGSGVAGLTAAYVASRTAQVTLFEADDRLGGHADTHVGATALAIDTGFIVHNPRTYPVLLRLFAELGVPPSTPRCRCRSATTTPAWSGPARSAGGASSRPPRNLRQPRYLRMLAEIPRFHRLRQAGRLATLDRRRRRRRCGSSSTQGRFSAYFMRHFMEPLVAAVWSCDPEVALDYPARYLFTFLEHHGMLGIFGSPQWRTVTGGSREYVRRVAAELAEIRTRHQGHLGARDADGVEVTDGNGAVTTYDGVVIATHPPRRWRCWPSRPRCSARCSSAMPYSANTALLHTDTSLLPTRRTPGRRGTSAPTPRRSVTYDLTRLQRLPTDTHYLVTLGGEHLVDPAR